MEYTATYLATENGSKLPVVVYAEDMIDAAEQARQWRMRKAQDPVSDKAISREPVSIVNETLRMRFER